MEASMSPRAPQKCRVWGPTPDPAFSQAPHWTRASLGVLRHRWTARLSPGDDCPPGALGTLWRHFWLFYLLGWGWVLLESSAWGLRTWL